MKPAPIEIAVEPGIALRGLNWSGAEPAILLIHGAASDSDLDDWTDLVPYLLGAGSNVVAVDLRGHGMSDGEPDATATPADLQAIVKQLGAESLVAIAIGTNAPVLVELSNRAALAGMILISPEIEREPVARSGNIPKLIIGGTLAPEMRVANRTIQQASIGPTLTVHLPTTAQGKELFGGELGITCREHILSFIRERKLEVDRRFSERKGVGT
jgi:pimeloyl-ACP methyl ester carboxylesterase